MRRALLLAIALAPATAGATKVFLNASDQTGNPVACGGNEAQYADDTGKRAQVRLQAYGFDVQYSQDFTNSPSMANNWGADSFVSIHTNAGGGHGTETLYKDAADQGLAGPVNNAIVAALGLTDRGLKYRSDLWMLNGTTMEAVLTEILFHDCTTNHAMPTGTMSESCFLTSAEGRAIDAEAIAQGVCARWSVSCVPGPPPSPRLTLATEILDIAGQARDFDGDGTFDLDVGQETTFRFTVTNGADATASAANLVVSVSIQAPYLSIEEWHVYDNYPGNSCGGDWCLNSADSNTANPPHLAPGDAFELVLDGFSTGESKRVDLRVRGLAPSDGLHPEARLFVKHVDDFYEKSAWDAAPNNVGGYQTWNGGDLRILSAADVWPAETDAGPPGPGVDAGGGTAGADSLAGDCACRAGGREVRGAAALLALLALALGLARRCGGRSSGVNPAARR